MSLPLIARHASREDCGALSPHLIDEADGQPGEADERGEMERDNPFAVLKGLKTNDPDQES